MASLLSLPDELLEAVGTQVISRDKAGLREWCRVTSTCKRLWDMELQDSASKWSLYHGGDIEGESKVSYALAHSKVPCQGELKYADAGAPWILQRVRTTRELSINWNDGHLMELDVLRQNVKALIRASRSFDNLTTLVYISPILHYALRPADMLPLLRVPWVWTPGHKTRVQGMLCGSHWFQMDTVQGLDIHEELTKDSSMRGVYFQHWMSALLLGSPRLASLSMRADGVPLPPVLGRLSVRNLELTMQEVKPWLHLIMADLSLCSSLESLKIADDWMEEGVISKGLPDLFLHDVTTLKTVELVGWYPEEHFSLPPGCMLHVVVIMDSQAQWHQWQEKGLTSMLYLDCTELQAWPTGIQEINMMSGLR